MPEMEVQWRRKANSIRRAAESVQGPVGVNVVGDEGVLISRDQLALLQELLFERSQGNGEGPSE